MEKRKNMPDDVKQLNRLINLFESVRVVKNCKEWDWESRYPTLEAATDALLKQLSIQRELLLLATIHRRNSLTKKRD